MNKQAVLGAEAWKFDFTLQLRGMDKLVFVPTGVGVGVAVSASWPHPSFVGRFLPETREITDDGFSASWKISRFATGIDSNISTCAAGDCTALLGNNFGISLINSVDVYFKSERATKYGILFLALSFTYFFLFEVMKGARIHPVHYLLVGLALAVFFLLLIALAEHVPFLLAYAVATTACVALIASYVRHALDDQRHGVMVAVLGSLLYGVLYVIIGAEDYALLMGSALLFSTLALVMNLTRKLDWYEFGDAQNTSTPVEDLLQSTP